MDELQQLFSNNRRWADKMKARDPEFFERLSAQQSPKYLWIGCADSRVPANEIIGLLPGEVFVHRNVANVVVHADLNCLSVVQYAVDVLKVEHIIVCGHYGCGGVAAALDNRRLGLIDNWLRHKHAIVVESVLGPAKLDTLCELNVIEQAANVCHSTVMQDAWARGHQVTVHGWIYRLQDGELRDLGASASSAEDVEAAIQRACDRLSAS